MKKITILHLLIFLFYSVYAQENKAVSGTIDFISPELYKLINKEAKVEVLAEGFQFTEGPVWVEKDQMLLFSDVPGNTIYKWTAAVGKELYLPQAGYTDSVKRGGFMGPNGLIISNDGKLMICQHGDRRIVMMDAPLNDPQGKFSTVADQYNGKRFNSPNDLCFAANGDLYFTDPWYGLEKGPKDPGREITYQGVYKLDRTGRVTLLIDSIEAPNGIAVFPDGNTLLVSNSGNRNKRWYAYTIAQDGSLINERIFYDASNEKESGGCDGLKIDSQGNVFATGPGGIWIFTKTGTLIGKIKINGSIVANCALTPDGKTVYLTATKYLLRVKMR
ncbi:SMP-30/gluconolactonase/LRE family protein [Pseudobacter ginsenosidimutans]|uniref:Gluconolactonase n=1 Tax=Pseudobacter ginsenosidimutans TaxID=661488 RepID=A0A4Q7MDM0_9BACT|nr:SMP-30/gluconolactonase/LRE family protein [Pseudobacter ginsenosidimutans]QEC45194.1 SMP-30/gluconolactonase/LRE family protein [Pseudobacter ginsenosidimutans]RZS65463.1 gluconolactonase [Pseudobacter ginsenosidimutans]